MNTETRACRVVPVLGQSRALVKCIHETIAKKQTQDLRSLDLAALSWSVFGRKGKGTPPPLGPSDVPMNTRDKLVRDPSKIAWLAEVLEEKQKTIKNIYGETGFTWEVLNSRQACLWSEAKNFLEKEFPSLHEMYMECVSHVVFVCSQDLISFTVPQALGLVVVAPKEKWELAHFLEALVHESTHIELTMRQQLDPLLKNRKELSSNPLRKDPRPLNGTFHAALVLCRTCMVLDRLPDSEARNSLLDTMLKKRKLALEELREKAVWTAEGQKLFDEMHLVSRQNSVLETA